MERKKVSEENDHKRRSESKSIFFSLIVLLSNISFNFFKENILYPKL